jgi:phosphoglucosamine mutase
MGKLFGTDGVRGVANEHLTPLLAYKLGRAGAYVLTKNTDDPQIVIGKDTRISGDMLEAALIAGICSVGVDILKVGIMPTPGIAYLTRELKAHAGVVISASHNPVADNGIKFFTSDGYKLPDNIEEEIEALILGDVESLPRPTGAKVGEVYTIEDAIDRYAKYAEKTIGVDLKGLKIVVDCANGAGFEVGPKVLKELGAEVIPLNYQPDGININEGCGSTHPEKLQSAVVAYEADLGIAFDGDADRVIAVDEAGNIVDGDHIMVIVGLHRYRQNKLPKNTIVVTVMSNLGLKLAFQKEGINVLETKVGDRYVFEELMRSGTAFGGEQSGHIISLDYNTTGDGLINALQLIAVVQETKQSLSQLAKQMTRLPQVLVNIKVADKTQAMEHEEVKAAITQGENTLGETGRILVRASGTEPIVRVMAEGPCAEELDKIVHQIASVITKVAC